jgi:hypothetical protein
MPLVEFAGVSGVGKTTLLNALFQFKKLSSWNTNKGVIPLSSHYYSDTGDVLTSTYRKLWDMKIHRISGQPATEATRNFELGIASWHLRWDQSFPHHHSGPFRAIDEHFLQVLFPELSWLTKTHPEEAKTLLHARNFVLLTDEPENILLRVRQRQVNGPLRPHLEGWSDAKILVESENFQTAMLAFLQEQEHFGYNWFVINMSHGFDAAMSKAHAYLLGLENIYHTPSSST